MSQIMTLQWSRGANTAESAALRRAREEREAASMEPRCEHRGELPAGWQVKLLERLQWSRGANTAERASSRERSSSSAMLQWSRGANTAESVRNCGTSVR